MKIQQMENFKPSGEVIEVTDTEVISGVLPDYLDRSIENAIRRRRLRAYLRYTCGGLGNALSLQAGRGLVIVSDSRDDVE